MADFKIKSLINELYETYDKGELKEKKHSFLSIRHTSSYDKFFEDYIEYTETDETGRLHVKRVYEGDYYEAQMSPVRRTIVKILLGMLWIAAAVVFVTAGVRYAPLQSSNYIIVGQLGIIIGLGWMLLGLYNYYTSPARHTVGDHKASSDRIINSSICGFIAFGFTAAASIIQMFTDGNSGTGQLPAVLLYAAGFVIMIAVYVIEKKIKYVKSRMGKE